jgi:hypothetical protein
MTLLVRFTCLLIVVLNTRFACCEPPKLREVLSNLRQELQNIADTLPPEEQSFYRQVFSPNREEARNRHDEYNILVKWLLPGACANEVRLVSYLEVFYGTYNIQSEDAFSQEVINIHIDQPLLGRDPASFIRIRMPKNKCSPSCQIIAILEVQEHTHSEFIRIQKQFQTSDGNWKELSSESTRISVHRTKEPPRKTEKD